MRIFMRAQDLLTGGSMTRREQRNTVMQLLFENDFRREDTPETVYARAKETREFPE